MSRISGFSGLHHRAGPGDQQENRGTLSESGKGFFEGVSEEELAVYQGVLEKVKENVLRMLDETSGSETAEQESERTTCLSLQNI